MLAQKNAVFEEACETVFKLNQDDRIRYLCEAREDGERILRTYRNLLAQAQATNTEKDSIIAEKDSALAEKDATIAMLRAELEAAKKNSH